MAFKDGDSDEVVAAVLRLLADARREREITLEQLADGNVEVADMATVAQAAFPSVTLTGADANAVRYGRTIDLGKAWARAARPAGISGPGVDVRRAVLEAAHPNTPDWAERTPRPHALFAPDGEFLALARPRPDDTAEYLAVFAQPSPVAVAAEAPEPRPW